MVTQPISPGQQNLIMNSHLVPNSEESDINVKEKNQSFIAMSNSDEDQQMEILNKELDYQQRQAKITIERKDSTNTQVQPGYMPGEWNNAQVIENRDNFLGHNLNDASMNKYFDTRNQFLKTSDLA